MPDELAIRRFERADLARDTRPADMLNKVLADIAKGNNFDHVMVLCVRRADDGGAVFRRYQAGDFNYIERIGMIENFKMDEWEKSSS